MHHAEGWKRARVRGIASRILSALAISVAFVGAAQAQGTQPSVVQILPAAGSTLQSRPVFALKLARPPAQPAQALCDVWGLRSSAPVEVFEGSKRQEVLRSLGVPASEIDPAGGSAWVALRCQATLPDGAHLSLRWLRPERPADGSSNEAGGYYGWDGLRFEYKAQSEWPLTIQCGRSNAGAGCNPLERVVLQFENGVSTADLAQVRLRSRDGRRIAPLKATESQQGEFTNSIEFHRLAPNERYEIIWPAKLTDDNGRDALARARKAAPLTVRMGPYPPLVKFGASFGIAERAIGGVVPLTVRGVEGVESASGRLRTLRVTDDAGIVLAYQELMRVVAADDTRARHASDEFDGGEAEEDAVPPPAVPRTGFRHPFPYPKQARDTRGISWLRSLREAQGQPLPRKLEGRTFEVLGVPLAEPGFYLLEAESRTLGRGMLEGNRPMFVRAGALVTDLGVHMHLSHRAAAVWVTRLSNGQPVADARVSFYDCKAKPQGSVRVNAQGWGILEKGLRNEWNCPLYAVARQGDDVGFVQSRWQRGIESWRFDSRSEFYAPNSDQMVHAVLARNLLRPGETLHARLYWRRIGISGALEAPAAASLPKTVELVHVGSRERRSMPVTWDARGNAELVMPLPSGIKRGTWTIGAGVTGMGGEFRVEDFRLPVLKAEVISPPGVQVLRKPDAGDPARVEVSVRLSYLSGGAAAGEQVQLFQRLTPHPLRFESYSEFWFGTNQRFRDESETDAEALAIETDSETVGDDKAVKLDANGTAQLATRFVKPPPAPSILLTEMEYRDPNGETYRAQGRTPVWPAGIVLGIRTPWEDTADRTAEFVALDPHGKPVAGIEVKVEGGWDGYVSHRRKTVGGYYSYSSERREFKPAPMCSGRTDARGRFVCRYKPEAGEIDMGEYRIQAVGTDAQGRSVRVASSTWVYGRGEVWFTQSDHDRIDVIADKKRYQPGETATLQVRSPFREATALVSVMRSGTVVDTLVVPLSGKQPTVTLPIKASYAPNVFINVLAVRGRVAAPAPTALVDLARPAYKLGILPLEVGSESQRLKVAVRTDRTQYQSREKARVDIQVTPSAGSLPAHREATVFVVDEALLELLPNPTWQLFEAMTARRGYGFETSSAAMQVIGKRHYGRKALPPGGGGGRSAARELFDTLLVWRGSVALDAQGRAQVEVPINDSLTRFRVVVVANAGADRFGTGEASFVATRDLQILSGLPATVRDGDRFTAGFTLRNTTAQPMQASVEARLNDKPLSRQSVALAPGEAKGVAWPVDVPSGATELKWRLDAQANTAAGPRKDALAVQQAVHPTLMPTRFTVTAAELASAAAPLSTRISPPAGSVPGRGELRVSLAPALAADASGVRDYMRSYPFYCLEQRTSKAVSLKDKALWAIITDRIDEYVDTNGLVNYYPGGGGGYDVLTSFVLSASHEAGWRLPADAERRMLDGLDAFVRGKLELRHSYYHDDSMSLTERKLLALEALARLRPVGAELAESLKLDSARDLPRLSHRGLVQWLDLLNRVNWPRKAAALNAALAELDKRLLPDVQAGLRLRSQRGEQVWYLMYSEAAAQVRLALLALDLPQLADRAGPLARAAVNMQRGGGTWWETQANVWGSLMLDKRAQRASSGVSGSTTISVGSATQVHDWARLPQGETYVFPLDGANPVSLAHRGTGKPSAQVVGTAWSELKQAHEEGATVSRTLRALKQAVPGRWSAGDIVEVKLKFKVPGNSGWLVLSDPIPTGATLLGSGLKGQAPVSAGEGKGRGWRSEDGSWEAWPTYVERSFTHVRAYYEYLWWGNLTLTYQMRINNAGQFRLPPTQLEAMYDPSVFAYQPNAPMEVK